ncbi:hypothetical protein BC941DRAFT_441311 [Chlamydoabsidia padenii]|nr:hypothetical protein BC941DRAFT_441311 [Chlamydoabsidia padenii]
MDRYSDPFINSTHTMATMLTIHGNNHKSAATITPGIPIVSSYSQTETENLLDDYSTSTYFTNTLSAPPPSPQDASPLDNLFAQRLTSQLEQSLIFATSATSPSSAYSALLSDMDSNNMDASSVSSLSSSPLQDNRISTVATRASHLSPVMVPNALPLTCTTTYRPHQHTKLTTKHHQGVDPLQLDFLLRRVTKSRRHLSYSQSRHSRQQTKRIGGFHKRPSRIPLYTHRINKIGDKDRRMDYPLSSVGSRTSWKQNAMKQKTLAISTAVEKWKQLKHYDQGDNKPHEEVDRIVQDLEEMGL